MCTVFGFIGGAHTKLRGDRLSLVHHAAAHGTCIDLYEPDDIRVGRLDEINDFRQDGLVAQNVPGTRQGHMH